MHPFSLTLGVQADLILVEVVNMLSIRGPLISVEFTAIQYLSGNLPICPEIGLQEEPCSAAVTGAGSIMGQAPKLHSH